MNTELTDEQLEIVSAWTAAGGSLSDFNDDVVLAVHQEGLPAPAAQQTDGRDCGCAHYWNCPSLKPTGKKPVLRPAPAAQQPVGDVGKMREALAAILAVYGMPYSVKRLAEEALATRPSPAVPECEWHEDGEGSTWEGSCGAVWQFTSDGPAENGMHYCPQCGARALLAAQEKQS